MYADKDKMRAWFRERYRKNCEYVQTLKLERGCADCGYSTHHAGLEFDHLVSRKRGTVASQMGKSLKVILEEIALCEVVCGTCHAIRTWERGQKVV